MFGFLLRRAGLVVPTFLGITLLVFSLIHMIPGNAVEAMSGEHGMDPARYARLLHEFGLDQPLYVQYLDYLGKLLKGDLGFSIITHEPVLSEFLKLFPATLELSCCAMLLALVIGLPAGILAALKRNTFLDYSVMGVSLTGYSMPIFWW
ncbi:MAG: glutathione ABC transporter permease GsiC, partial [Sterolibacterium sp.]